MTIESSEMFLMEYEAKMSTLTELEQKLARHLLKYMQADYYDQDRHIHRFTKMLNAQAQTDQDKHTLLVDLTRNLLGDYYATVMNYIIDHATEYSYATGYDRRPFRTKNIAVHLNRIIEKCASLHDLAKHRVTILDILNERNHDIHNQVISDIIAYELDRQNDDVLSALKEVIYGDNNTALLTREMIKGMLQSHSEEAYNTIGELLIAARLQEGLRQSILETMDEGTLAATTHLLKVILHNNLIRYSSVVRAIDVWTGLTLEAEQTRVTKQVIQYIHECLTNLETRNEWLQSSEDLNKLYTSLWASAVIEEDDIERQVNRIMKSGETYQKVVAQYILSQSQNERLKYTIASKHLDETDLELRVFLLNNYTYECHFTYNWNRKTNQYTHKLQFERIPELEEKSERLRQFTLLKTMLDNAPQKEITIKSRVFTGLEVTYSADLIVRKMLYLIAYDMDQELLLQIMEKKDIYNADTRGYLLDCFTTDPSIPVQRNYIFSCLSDKSMTNREKALSRILDLSLTPKEIEKVEAILKLKTGNLRQNAIKLLLKLEDAKLETSLDRLLTSKSELQRVGGLEMISELKEATSEKFITVKDKWKVIKTPTDKEKLLMDKLTSKEEYSSTNGFGLYIPDEQCNLPTDFLPRIESSTVLSTDFTRIQEILTRLSELIHAHREHQYEVDWYGHKGMQLVGAMLSRSYNVDMQSQGEGMDGLPLAEVWRDFFDTTKTTTPELIELHAMFSLDLVYRYRYKRINNWEMRDYKKPNAWNKELLDSLYPLEKVKAFYTFAPELPYYSQMNEIVSSAFHDLKKEEIFNTASGMLHTMLEAIPEEKRKSENHMYQLVTNPWLDWTKASVYDDATYKTYFLLLYKLYTFNSFQRFGPDLEELVRAYDLQLIDENELTKELVGRENSKDRILALTRKKNGTPKTYPTIEPIKEKVLTRILEIELKRGDLQTEVTALATGILYYEGMEYLITLLTGLDKDTFVRGYFYSFGNMNVTKKEALSHLLQVCHPKKGEDEDLLAQLVKEKKISDKRLLEAAMYAPQWLDIVAAHLKWDGLKSAAWYFHAHTNERFSAEKETKVAHYSPITPEEFHDGAFDIHWFKEAYGQLGEERFAILYDCAKYISSGANHRRAQLFADATLGKLTLADMKTSVQTKRNKDHLLCYSLIPIEPSNTNDVLERYEFIQKFLKESKSFGAQRRASEAKICAIALDNLARNAGYKDVTRLRWDMETRKMEDVMHALDPVIIDDVTVQLVIDENGKGDIKVIKNNKELKSIPTKLKKHDYILELKEVNAGIKEQYIRAKAELERSMELETPFTLQELINMMKNPVVAPLVKKLVFKADDTLGFFTGDALQAPAGECHPLQAEDNISIAHPVHLYESENWSDYQRFLFEQRIKQPFKQVFRELYRLNADELAAGIESRRYAGHQVQPRKAVALLKNRMWTVNYEEGLQKVYHKENIIAKIYAMADWFSPSDVESPTLETVEFFDRNTYKNISLSNVPKIIFSETMRDVDLVVSIAHVGGVDPEASLTTIEMRVAILQESLRLMKVTNVRIEGNFALIKGTLGEYAVHLGSAMAYQQASGNLHILPVHSQHRGKLFLPFLDEDPKTAEILSKVIMLAEDKKIKDPSVLMQISGT
ncbi:DUF4132 domain-containing protein [Bacillus tianshenii]|uniref:DUF4132 domain-containing protein n=1 Tax=Sutcliffiella tianshenii TaxID=1463404 RepID=UPI001CD578B5|nr:DUF4132 domain-containing protein [Bacillus tianshenii]MCA1318398.1 DUF4132 domain-containing protein [Bacillus tianshenii]